MIPMSIKSKRLRIGLLVLSVAALSLGAFTTASANHSWGGYHWARTSNPFTLKIGDNVTAAWDSVLDTAITDWTASAVLDMTKVAGLSNPKNCKATAGRVEVCNSKYGKNGWLGIASVWATGGHISQGTVKLNDTYYSTPTYNTTAWRNLVMCQEIGHTIGLNHQDEDFNNANLGTCMDYTNSPADNQHPNQHDFDQLVTIYTHLDTNTTVGQTTVNGNAAVDYDDQSTWGKAIRTDEKGRDIAFERNIGNQKVFTFVVWAE